MTKVLSKKNNADPCMDPRYRYRVQSITMRLLNDTLE